MATTTTRANKIATVIIPVADQDGAVDFYVNKLGFETAGRRARSATATAGSRLGSATRRPRSPCAPPPEVAPTGKRETGISLQTDDIDAYHRELRRAGVDVDAEVSRMGEPVPPMFWLRDPEGNTLMVVQYGRGDSSVNRGC